MPGGKVDFGEDPKESLRREFKEEVGLDIRVEKPYRTFSYESENSARHTVEIVYVTCLQDTREEKVDIVLGKDHTKYIWVKKDTLEPLLISREMKKSIECGFEEEGKYNKLKESLEKDILH